MTSNIITIEQIKEKTIPILRNYPADKEILYGSYAKGKVTNKSDIDLYIDYICCRTLVNLFVS